MELNGLLQHGHSNGQLLAKTIYRDGKAWLNNSKVYYLRSYP